MIDISKSEILPQTSSPRKTSNPQYWQKLGNTKLNIENRYSTFSRLTQDDVQLWGIGSVEQSDDGSDVFTDSVTAEHQHRRKLRRPMKKRPRDESMSSEESNEYSSSPHDSFFFCLSTVYTVSKPVYQLGSNTSKLP